MDRPRKGSKDGFAQDSADHPKKGGVRPPPIDQRADMKEAHNLFIQKLTNPFTPIDDLRDIFLQPIPQTVGTIQCTIMRHKSGFNRLWPKYTMQLSDGQKFLLTGKKRSGNATSNYMITIDQEKLKKNTKGYLGKTRSNFLGTEFYLFDDGKNPKKAKTAELARAQYGAVLYETNVLGSKGPRRMKVVLPEVDKTGKQHIWKTLDVKYRFLTSVEEPVNKRVVQEW